MEWRIGCFCKDSINSEGEQLDATAGGLFMSLTFSRAETLIDKIAENQSWKKRQYATFSSQIEEASEEVCVLSSKMDVLLDWLDQ
jgi:hypothetical protein